MFSLIFKKKNSTEQLVSQLQSLSSDLDQITKQLELLEIKRITSNYNTKQDDEAQYLIQKQNVISYEILELRKEMKKRQNKLLFKAELILLPSVLLLLLLTFIF